MGRIGLLAIAGALLATFISGAPAQAQATRTWVSGVGDDASPCSRTAPCKTFAGAISKTATGGEIDVLDPGGFGAVTITKAISIYNDGVGEAGLLVSGTNGIIVNIPTAGATDVVNIRGLVIDGINNSSGQAGVTFLGGAQLNIQNCVIQEMGTGVSFTPSNGNAVMKIQNTTIQGNGAGMLIKPTGGFNAKVEIERTRVDGNGGGGVKADGTGGTGSLLVGITDSSISLNASNGINAVSGAGGGIVNVSLMRDAIVGNGLAGVQANTSGPFSNVLVGSSLLANNGSATSVVGTGVVNSYVTNQVLGPIGSGFTNTSLQ